jgi:hopanoid biosynthesis associated protein HpnK
LRRLIVTADDFGAAPQVNDAVELAHREGVLTSASLMVAAPGCSDAVARARTMPRLRVGLHLVLVEGRPMSPIADLPDLVTRHGVFRTDMAALGAEAFFRPKVRRQFAAEIDAQFAAFAATGLPLDHANAHKHYHLHPTIAGLMLAIGRRYGLSASRAPIEPRAVLAAVEPSAAPGPALLTEPWARRLRARFRRAGIAVADQVFGLAWSGHMTAPRVAGIARHLSEGLSELYLHPATAGGFEGAAEGYDYAGELSALLSPQVRQACVDANVTLGGFSDFRTRSAVPTRREDA